MTNLFLGIILITKHTNCELTPQGSVLKMAMPKREVFEQIIQRITSQFPDVYAALFISPEGFPINSWGVTMERAEEISALLSSLIGKTKDVISQVKEGGDLKFIQIQTNMGGIKIAPQEEFILVTLTHNE